MIREGRSVAPALAVALVVLATGAAASQERHGRRGAPRTCRASGTHRRLQVVSAASPK